MTKRLLFIFGVFIGFLTGCQTTSEDSLTLENESIRIVFNEQGKLLEIGNKATNSQYIDGSTTIWKLVLEKAPFEYDTLVSSDFPAKIQGDGDKLMVSYDAVSLDSDNSYKISYAIHLEEDEIVWKAHIANSGKYRVASFEFPIITCKADFSATKNTSEKALFWPHRPGERIANPANSNEKLSIKYPGYATMQWMEYGDAAEGLYFTCLDSTLNATYLNANGKDGTLTMSMTKYPFTEPDETWSSYPYVLSPHQGDWHTGAKKYRQWADTWIEVQEQPKWVKEDNGWLLTIMKQQNGDIMWKYDELDKVLKVAKQQGLDMLGLFGWAIGGHDHLYPDYSLDPNMGNLEDLKSNTNKVRDKGGQTALFVNGQLVDTVTTYFKTQGKDQIIQGLDGKVRYETWRKFFDAPGYTHAVMCPSTEGWSNTLMDLTKYIADVGADAIFYDQIGFGGASSGICLTPEHNHDDPAAAVGPGIYQNIKEIRTAIKQKYPDFAFMTEGLNDAVSSYFDFNHGSGDGYEYKERSFPALFRYTFPEIIFTNRYSSPYMSPDQANFAFINGLRFDVETRYVADVELLLEGKRPTREYYENLVWPPNNIEELMNAPVTEYAAYLRKLSDLRSENDILLNGKFVDTEGFKIDNDDVRARAFQKGNKLAVVVWNNSEDSQAFGLRVDGKTLVKKVFMNDGDSNENLGKNSLAVLFYE